MEVDERKNWSWPLSRAQEIEKENNLIVDDPPKPIDGFYFDNCYNEAVPNEN